MPKLHSAAPALDRVELAAILAGLRLLQIAVDHNAFPPGVEEIATDCGEFNRLNVDEIDALCERINCGE